MKIRLSDPNLPDTTHLQDLLKPCPKCGGKVWLRDPIHIPGGYDKDYFIWCEVCCKDHPTTWKTPEEAVEQWNKGIVE